MLLYQVLASTLYEKNIKKSHPDINRFKISAPTQNDKFELPVGSDSALHIQNYFEYIFKNHEVLNGEPLIRICINKTQNRIILILLLMLLIILQSI